MLKSLLYLFIFLCSFQCIAQDINKRYIDSVLVSVSRNDKEQLRTGIEAIQLKLSSLPRDEANPLYKYLIEKTNNPFIKMMALGDLGEFLIANDVPDKAIAYLNKGLELSKNHGETEDRFRFHVSLANAYIFQNRAEEALFHLNIAESMAAELNRTDAIASVNYSKGMMYESIEDFEQATTYYLKAWDTLNLVEDHPERGFYLFVLVDYFKRLGNIKEQTRFTELLTNYYSKRQPEIPFTHLPSAHIFDTSATAENIKRYKDVIRVSDSMGAINSMMYSSLFLSNIYLKEGDPQAAIEVLEPLIRILDSTDRRQQKMVLYEKLSFAYEAGKDFKNALKFKNMVSKLRDTLVSEITKKNIAELEVKYDLQTKERELEQQSASKKLLYWILGSVFVVLVILSVFFLKNSKKNQKLAQQKTLLEATVDEKNVLLKETHHRVKNSFQIVSSLLYLQSENMQDSEAQQAIKEAQNRVRSMVLIHQKLYNKDQLVGIDTQEYFHDLTREIFDSHQENGKTVNYVLQVESMMLDIESITPIGLILNELITNVLKHAYDVEDMDRKMEISFQKEGNRLILKVSDNGKGMPEQVHESSFGIKLMKALAKKLKATLQFKKAPENGTIAILEVSRFNLLT
jgi:two-component sensor histidine kinase